MALVSMIFPYWQRQKVTNEAIAKLNKLYGDFDMEIVVVDDGSPEPFVAPDSDISIKVIRLSAKTEPKDPCVPMNRGVENSSGEIVCLANPELMHDQPVLLEMVRQLTDIGERGVVMASVWCPDDKRWHVHPSIGGRTIHGVKMPPWENSTFLAVMFRKFWSLFGGFDEEYRDGWGYDDHDLVLRMAQHDPTVIVRPDLVVTHSRTGAKSAWTQDMLARNRKLFVKKWKR